MIELTFKQVFDLAPWNTLNIGFLAVATRQAGDDESQGWASAVVRSNRTLGAAMYHAVAGHLDPMIEALEGAYERKDWDLLSISHFWFLDPYRAHPRFQALLKRMNLA